MGGGGALDDVGAAVTAVFDEQAWAGLVVGVVRAGELAWCESHGSVDSVGAGTISARSSFCIASITKTITAIALMQLWERGRFKLDEPVNDHLRSYRVGDGTRPPVTIRHLLTHTAGIGELRRLSDLTRPALGIGLRRGERQPDLHHHYAPVLSTEVDPGTKWAYANHGFATLGVLVEDLTGARLPDYAADNIFGPLGMRGTQFQRPDTGVTGYRRRRGTLVKVPWLEVLDWPAGAVWSTVDDMALYVAALLNGGANEHGRVLEAATLDLMTTAHHRADDGLPGMGLAFMLDDLEGHRVFGHDGGWPGFSAAMMVAPDDDVAVVAFTNTSTFALHGLVADIVGRQIGLPPAADLRTARPVAAHPHTWSNLVGSYRPPPGLNTNFRLLPIGELEVSVRGGRLQLRPLVPLGPLRTPLLLEAPDAADPLRFQTWFAGTAINLRFRRDTSGTITGLAFGSSFAGYFTLLKRPRWASLRNWMRATAAVTIGITARRVLRRRRR